MSKSPIGPPLEQFVEVAVSGMRGSGGGGQLTYQAPDHLRGSLSVGQTVWAPLRGKPALGVIVALHNDAPDFALKPLIDVVDPPIHLTPDQLETARWIARETASHLYEAISLFLPPGGWHQVNEYLRLATPDPSVTFTRAQSRLLDLLATKGEVSLESARTALGSPLTSVVPALQAAGAIEVSYRISSRHPAPQMERWVRLRAEPESALLAKAPNQAALASALHRRSRLLADGADGFVPSRELLDQTGLPRATLTALVHKGLVEEIERPAANRGLRGLDHADRVPEFTPAQAAAWTRIEETLVARCGAKMLLYGVTGSGKTELYLRGAAWCLRNGRSTAILVPEIALSSQVAGRFIARFGDRVAVLHSALSDAERFAAWQGIASGRHPIVVGPRSALFAPLRNLGLIVLDEEHDQAYKQDASPRYHARAVAERMAAQSGATLLLGSATPSTETYWRALQGDITLLSLPDRVGPNLRAIDGSRATTALELPRVDIVDMRLELHRGNSSFLSEPLQDLLTATLRRGEQAILLLNRRGMATVVLCRSCGVTLACPYCDIPLVYHQDREQLVCHRCDHREAPQRACRACGGPLDYFGAGTQRIESEAQRRFPGARVLRWDQDAVRRSAGSGEFLQKVSRGDVDIIVGTQMVAKGFDLPLVTAIGVINADTGLHLPDFRSGERTFSLLTQVAGRAGRRGPGSRVIVQSYTPEHYAIQAASHHDYEAFFAEEIDFRRTHRYPPFVRLARFLYRHKRDEACAQAADELARALARHSRQRGVAMDLLGPAPAFASRVRGEYQWQVILRSTDLESLLDGLPAGPGWVVDIDPQSLL